MDYPYFWYRENQQWFAGMGWQTGFQNGDHVAYVCLVIPEDNVHITIKVIIGLPDSYWTCRHIVEFPYVFTKGVITYLGRMQKDLEDGVHLQVKSNELVFTWSCHAHHASKMPLFQQWLDQMTPLLLDITETIKMVKSGIELEHEADRARLAIEYLDAKRQARFM